MKSITRRDALKTTAGAALTAAVASPSLLASARAFAAESPWKPEKGCKDPHAALETLCGV